MSDSIEVRRDNIRVEFQDLEDKDTPTEPAESAKNDKWAGVWAVSFSFYRRIIFGGRKLNVWSHWFSLPTKLKLDTPTENVKACGEKFLAVLELFKHALPKEDKDFGPLAKLNVDSGLKGKLTSIANGE